MTQTAPNLALPGLPQATGKLIRQHRCETCKFAEKNPAAQIFECHARPPCASIVMSNKGPQTLTTFPMVQPNQWCGEWGPKIEQVN